MTKISKIYKTILVSSAIGCQIFNPLILVGAAIAEEPATSSAVMVTGDTTSITESQTQVNTVNIESQVETTLIPIASGSSQIETPFSTPTPSTEPETKTEPIPLNVSVENKAEIDTITQATATTGNNQQTATDTASMSTGEAVAIASSIVMANTTLINSLLQIGVIAILDSWDGDIILDPMTDGESHTSSGSDLISLDIDNLNTEVSSSTSASASTGENTQLSNLQTALQTGQATSIAQSNVIVNTTLINADYFALLAENLWLWNGLIRNWEYPGSISSSGLISDVSNRDQPTCTNLAGSVSVEVNNQAGVKTSTMAIASTGNNAQTGDLAVELETGNAKSLAVSTTMVNTTLINSRYRQLTLALFAPWTGDLIFAYPDLNISAEGPSQVTEGEQVPYKITIKNNGYADASDVAVETIITDSTGTIYEKKEPYFRLASGELEIITLDIPTENRGGQTLSLSVSVKNKKPEESMTNNNATVSTEILRRKDTSSSATNTSGEHEIPILKLSSVNNVNDFVYAGDSVTYDMIAYNDGPIQALRVRLMQKFYTPEGRLIGEFSGEVGSLGVNAKKRIHFLLTTDPSYSSGRYYTQSVLHGESDLGEGTDSNNVENSFMLKTKTLRSQNEVYKTEPVMAVAPEEVYVLGATNTQACQSCESIPWYIAISLGSLAYYFMCARRRDFAQAIKWGLALPLSAYAGLIFSNPDCVSTINFLPSASSLCIWFLPLAMLIYLIVMVGGKGITKLVLNGRNYKSFRIQKASASIKS